MNQCIRRLLSNTFRTCSNRRAVSTFAAPKRAKPEQDEAKKAEEERKRALHKFKPKLPAPAKVGASFLPSFPPPPKPFLRDVDEKALEELYETLAFLLRNHAARDYGLPTRPDGYLSVSRLVSI